MRRKDREVAEFDEIVKIIEQLEVARLGFVDGDEAYIVPLNFGFEQDGERLTLYFHGAREGRKVDLIEKTGRASFEMDAGHKLIRGERACDYSYAYACVMGAGDVRVLTEAAEKEKGLKAIMRKFSDREFEFDRSTIERTAVFELVVDRITAKRHDAPSTRA